MDPLLHAEEKLMCKILLDFAKECLADPKFLAKYEEWIRSRSDTDIQEPRKMK